MFYSLIIYIGNRKKNYTKSDNGLLEDITVPASEYKISKAKLLAQNFDNAIIYTKMGETKLASEEVNKAIILLAKHNGSSKSYEQITLNALLKNLTICYLNLAHNKTAPQNMNKVFESSQLFIAYGFLQKSQQEIKHKNVLTALEDINKSQECLALSAKYVKGEDLKTHIRLLEHTKQLLSEITQPTGPQNDQQIAYEHK